MASAVRAMSSMGCTPSRSIHHDTIPSADSTAMVPKSCTRRIRAMVWSTSSRVVPTTTAPSCGSATATSRHRRSPAPPSEVNGRAAARGSVRLASTWDWRSTGSSLSSRNAEL